MDGQLPLEPDGKTPAPPSRFSYTTNGVANPTLQMQPGEVQRWRLLNAIDGDNLQLVLVSNVKPTEWSRAQRRRDGRDYGAENLPPPTRRPAGDRAGSTHGRDGQGGQPGTYLLQTLDPNSGEVKASVSPYRDSIFPSGIDSGLASRPGTVLIFPAHVPVWVSHLVRVWQDNSSIRLRSQPSRSPVRPKT